MFGFLASIFRCNWWFRVGFLLGVVQVALAELILLRVHLCEPLSCLEHSLMLCGPIILKSLVHSIEIRRWYLICAPIFITRFIRWLEKLGGLESPRRLSPINACVVIYWWRHSLLEWIHWFLNRILFSQLSLMLANKSWGGYFPLVIIHGITFFFHYDSPDRWSRLTLCDRLRLIPLDIFRIFFTVNQTLINLALLGGSCMRWLLALWSLLFFLFSLLPLNFHFPFLLSFLI